ncbi:sulfurtransferase [Salinarchaeum chitinilyticum]
MTELLVSIDWLAERIGEGDEGTEDGDRTVRVVDVRDAWEYDGLGHLPGAINVPFDEFRSEAGPEEGGDVGHLPGAAAFAQRMGDAGLSREDTIVAYDDTNGVFAARFLVTALVYGFEDVHLLDGDLSAWRQSQPVSNEAVELPPTDVEPVRVEGDASPLVDADEVQTAIAEGSDAVLLDTRDQQEYDDGHLPGAVRFDWQEAVDPETRGVKPREELLELFADRGVTPDKRVILYCNTARRLSHTYVVLRWLGFEDVGIYEGSLTEWREIGGDLVASGG